MTLNPNYDCDGFPSIVEDLSSAEETMDIGATKPIVVLPDASMQQDTFKALGIEFPPTQNEINLPDQNILVMQDAARNYSKEQTEILHELAQKELTRALYDYNSILSNSPIVNQAVNERLHGLASYILTLRVMTNLVQNPPLNNPPPISHYNFPIPQTEISSVGFPFPGDKRNTPIPQYQEPFVFGVPDCFPTSPDPIFEKPRTHVTLAYDEQMVKEITDGTTINMDLGVYGLMSNVFQDVPFGQDKIYVDDNVYSSGAKKSAQEDPSKCHFFLTVYMQDQNDNMMTLCNTCSQKKKSIIYIKDARRVGNDLKMLVAFSCSGAPTDVKRPLRAKFTLFLGTDERIRKIILMQSTPVFRIYHHRRKRGREAETSPSPQEASEAPPIPNLAKKLKHRAKLNKCSFYGELVQPVKELFNHMREIVDTDCTNMKFNEPILHQALWNLNAFMIKNTDLLAEDSQLLVPLSELYLNLAAINNIVYDPDVQYTNPESEMEKLMKFNFEKGAETCLRVQSVGKKTARWNQIMQRIWKLNFSFDERKTCTCETCRFCHIAFIVKYATKNSGNSHSKIASSLEDFQIQTKQGKHWHKSLNGLLSKDIYFSWTFFFETQSPIGAWSRLWYPFKRIRESFLRSMKDIFYTNTIASSIVFKGMDISSFIPFIRLTVKLIDTVEEALTNYDKVHYPQFRLSDGIDVLVNGLKVISLKDAPDVNIQPPPIPLEENSNN